MSEAILAPFSDAAKSIPRLSAGDVVQVRLPEEGAGGGRGRNLHLYMNPIDMLRH